jgi:Rieske Fe-S protein
VQNANVAKAFVKGHVARGARRDPADVAAGEAAILDRDPGKVAAFRDDEGVVHCVDATCTHMGCTVAWNAVARTWDCPCHGSRFTVDGEVLYGPAVKPLAAR